jgi:uncharacterized protein (AIM24 family)
MRYKITTNGFSTITISKMRAGEKIYAERNSCIASSPVYSKADADAGRPTGALYRRRLMVTELEGQDYTPETKPTALTQKWADFKLGTQQTLDRKRIGERSYVLYEALADEQKVSFRSCFPGIIMRWNALPLADDEYYVAPKELGETTKSVHNTKDDKRPHGTLMAVRGSFLVADLHVSAKVYHTGDVQVVRLSETKDSFQKFTGDGMVFLEVHGDLQEIPLYPGEAVDVFPGYLLAFTEGVTLEMKAAGDVTLRNEENNDYVIRLRAGAKGGYVYTHSVRIRDFFGRNEAK